MSKKLIAAIGSFCVVRQKRAAAAWIPGDVVSMYKPAWYVKIKLPGGRQEMASSGYAICDDCLKVPPGEVVTKARPECRCRVPAVKFARDWLAKEANDWLEKRSDSINSWKQRKEGLLWREVKATYEANVPLSGRENYVKNVQRLYAIIEEATGKDAADQPVTVLTWDLYLDWVQMRQEAARRGWLDDGGVQIKDPWAILRADLKAKKLPPIDKETVRPCNTTLKSYLGAARAVVGPTGRAEYLRGLDLPAMTDFLKGKIKLPSPKGHQEIESAVYAKMYEGAAQLKGADLRLWVVDQMLWRFGCRPIEVWKAKTHWIEHDAGGPMFVLKNRPAEGYTLKAKERAIVRRYRIAPDLWAAMQQVMIEGGWLIGAKTKTEAANLVQRAHSDWVRKYVPEGKHSSYLLRHYVAGLILEKYGLKMASLFMGHATSATLSGEKTTVTESRYADSTTPLVALTWEDIAPKG